MHLESMDKIFCGVRKKENFFQMSIFQYILPNKFKSEGTNGVWNWVLPTFHYVEHYSCSKRQWGNLWVAAVKRKVPYKHQRAERRMELLFLRRWLSLQKCQIHEQEHIVNSSQTLSMRVGTSVGYHSGQSCSMQHSIADVSRDWQNSA